MARSSRGWTSTWSTDKKDGIYSWLITICMLIVNCIDDGVLKAFGVLLTSLSMQYDVDVWIVGSTLALLVFVGSTTAMVASPFVKCTEPRLMIMACGFFGGLGLVLASLTRTWTTFSICIIFTGITQRYTMLVIFSILPNYFDKQYGLGSAFLSAGRPIGTLALAPLTQMMLNSYGTRGTVLLLGAIFFQIVVVGALVKPQKNSCYHSVDTGMNYSDRPKKDRGLIKRVLNLFEIDLFGKPAFLSLAAMVFALVYGFQTWVTYVVPNAANRGLLPYRATLVATAGGVGQLLGLAVSGVIIDCCLSTPNKVSLLALLLTGGSHVANLWGNSFLILSLNSFVFGCGLASINVAYLSKAKNVAGGENIGTLLSYVWFVGAVAALISGSASGWLYDQTGSYDVSFLVVGGVQFAAAIILGVEMTYSCQRSSPE